MPIRPQNRSLYPSNWRVISLRIRTERAQGRCECNGECGLDHGERCEARHGRAHPETGSLVVLTVAHLDHAPQNCEDSNLRAMCQRCHLRYDRHIHKHNSAETRRNRKACGDLFAENSISAPQFRHDLTAP